MRKTYIILLGLLLLACSCKHYLDVKPQGKIIPETDEEYEAVLNYILHQIETDNNAAMGSAVYVFEWEYITDNLDANINLSETSNIPLYIGSQINTKQDYYAKLYSIIKDCNILIEEMSKRSSAMAKDMVAASYALKGVCYYNLLRSFCEPYDPDAASSQLGLSLVDKFDIEVYQQRSNLRDSGQYVVDLLERSLQYEMTEEKYLFTPDVVKAYLAKTLFWIHRWSDALEICSELLEKYPLSSGEEYIEMIKAPNATLGEVIIRSFTQGNSSDGSYSSIHNRAKLRPVNKTLVDLFASDGSNDVRYSLSFNSKRINAKTIKYGIRSSELSLMAAECCYHLEEPDKALAELNRLRSHRIAGVSDYTMETLPEINNASLIKVDATGQPLTRLLSAIFDERRKELYMEADRWYELKRNGRPEFWVISNARKYTTRKYLYTFPIMRTDVEVGGIKQNEGYTY